MPADQSNIKHRGEIHHDTIFKKTKKQQQHIRHRLACFKIHSLSVYNLMLHNLINKHTRKILYIPPPPTRIRGIVGGTLILLTEL